MPYAIFCSDPLDPRVVEPEFAAEVAAAMAAGLTPVVIDHDELDRRINPAAALRRSRFSGPGRAIYRGWMLSSESYDALFAALAEREVSLITTPAAYTACHHAPGSYDALRTWMARARWVEAGRLDDADAIANALSALPPGGAVIKDWVKSQAAGYWTEACFIPDTRDLAAALRVIGRFRELQGDSLVGGVVFRSALSLQPAGGPADEFRAFVLDGAALGCWPRSDSARRRGGPSAPQLTQIAAAVPSTFATVDFGQDTEGRWWVLEVGDGQVSSLPESADLDLIYKALTQRLST